jgi:F-box associated protein
MNAISLLMLPDEVVKRILPFFSLKELARMMPVCKKIRDYGIEIFNQHDLQYKIQYKIQDNILLHNVDILRVELKQYNHDLIIERESFKIVKRDCIYSEENDLLIKAICKTFEGIYENASTRKFNFAIIANIVADLRWTKAFYKEKKIMLSLGEKAFNAL